MIELEPAYILHSRPFSETSAILEVFTKSYGRIALLCKGIKRKNSKFKGLGSPFIPVLISYTDKNVLGNIISMEQNGRAFILTGLQLISALYINEILIKLLPISHSYPELFDIYSDTILELSKNKTVELPLRYFERDLLKCIGYEMRLTTDVYNNPINPEHNYKYIIDQGPILLEDTIDCTNIRYNSLEISKNKVIKNLQLKGNDVLSFVRGDMVEDATIKKVKLLMREMITYHLDGKPLNIRKMF